MKVLVKFACGSSVQKPNSPEKHSPNLQRFPDCLCQLSKSYSPQAKSGPPSGFVNKVL